MKKWLHIIFIYLVHVILIFAILYLPSAFLVGSCGALSGYSRIIYTTLMFVVFIGYPIWKAMDVYDGYKSEESIHAGKNVD